MNQLQILKNELDQLNIDYRTVLTIPQRIELCRNKIDNIIVPNLERVIK